MGITLQFCFLTALLFVGLACSASADPGGGARLQRIVLTGDPTAVHRVIITFDAPAGDSLHASKQKFNGRIRHVYRRMPAICAHLPEAALHAVAMEPGVVSIEADGRVRVLDELENTWRVAYIQSGAAHARGVTGTCVKVAVIDTGIDYNHPELSPNFAGGWDRGR